MIQRYILISFCFLTFISNIQGQCWQTVYSGGNGNDLNDIYISSDTVGWISDGLSGLYKTTNSGAGWVPYEVEEINRAFSVFFLSEEIGWVGHSARTIFKTINGGQHWTEYNFSMDEQSTPRDIEFINADTGYMVSNYARVYRSTDGGENWEIVFENEDWLLSSLDFVSGKEGWIAGSVSLVGETKVLHTNNGGLTWEEQLIAPPSGSASFGPNVDLHFLNAQTGWFVNNSNLIYKTENGGQSWNSYIISEEENTYCRRTFFVNDTLGWAPSTYSKKVFVTTNGGESWHSQSTDAPFYLGNTSIFMTGPDHGVSVYWSIIKHYQGGPADCNINLLSPSTTTTALQPEIKWQKVPGCVDGYRLSVGLVPGGTEILGPLDVGLDTSYLMPFELLEGMPYYIEVVPYNYVHGLATTCGEPFAFTSTTCPPTNLVDTSFCDPPFLWADTSFEEAGTYLFEYLTPLGCDSVVVLVLSQEADVFMEVDTALVVGQPYNGTIYLSDTLFTEVYAAANGCDSIVQVQITLITGIQEPDFISQWQVFPNPTSSALWFRFSSRIMTSTTLELYDAQGRLLFATELSVHTGENSYILEAIRDWPVGLYWYQLETEAGRLSGKVVKE